MTKTLTVYGYSLGTSRRIVAAASQAAAARALGVSSSHFRQYACQTYNAVEIALATGKPGAVFMRPLSNPTFATESYTQE